jgi:hypothetical protein
MCPKDTSNPCQPYNLQLPCLLNDSTQNMAAMRGDKGCAFVLRRLSPNNPTKCICLRWMQAGFGFVYEAHWSSAESKSHTDGDEGTQPIALLVNHTVFRYSIWPQPIFC